MFPIQPPVNTASDKSSIANLHEILILLQIKPDEGEVKEKLYGDGTRKAIQSFQRKAQLNETDGFVGSLTAQALNAMVNDQNGFPAAANDYKVVGRVLTNAGVPLRAVKVIAYDKQLSGDTALGEATTDRKGQFSITYTQLPQGKDLADIEVQALDGRDGKNVIGRSAIRYNAGSLEVMEVTVNEADRQQASEYERLIKDMQSHLGALSLAELEESKDKQQISYLSNKTGWEPRLVAMAAQANKLAAANKMDAGHVYALFRTGVINSASALTALSSDAAAAIIKKAGADNIIGANGNIDNTVSALKLQTTQFLLDTAHPSAVSNMSSMLAIRLKADQQKIFTDTIQEVENDTNKFWSSLKSKGFEENTIKQLQLDGKMGYLTGQNAPLIKRVYEKYQIGSEEQLVQRKLYKAEEWKSIIGNDVPKDVTVDEYATRLANEVRFSYPTAVAAEMVNNKEIEIGPQQEVYKFMADNQSKRIIGKEPVKKWEGYNKLSKEAQTGAKTLERLYQMSPSDESMIALSKAGFDSAYQVASYYTKQEFVEKYAKTFPNQNEAALTYTKASEINSAALNLATTYLTSRAMPNVYALTGQQQKTQHTATIANPTLEELFGNLDYCACDHCKSVLSPAAYLVDLLQFIDLAAVPHEKQDPLPTLFKRRPDIQHIQLTCENTNVALPYIDLVNEILEHYILNGDLTTLVGHDVTEDTKQSDLLAEPQFVSETAYDELKTKVYPYNLPYHHALENLRLLFKLWDTTLPQALELFGTALPARKEQLELNEDEYKTLTDTSFKKLPEYYNEAPAASIAQLNAAIADGKTFCRRVDISYEDLVLLLKTNFINPGYSIVPLLTPLKISLIDIQGYYNGTVTEAQMDAKIPAGINAANYGGNVKQWLRDNQQLIMGLITLTDMTGGSSECNFASVQLRYALPDNNTNQLNALSYHKFHRFLRLLKKTKWSIDTLDYALTVLSPVASQDLTDANIDATFVTILARLANLKKAAQWLNVSDKKLPELLLLWDAAIDQTVREEAAARYLKLNIPDMQDLAEISGLNPLANDLENDEPSFIQWIQFTRDLKAASLKVVDLNYILRHKDLNNKLTPDTATLLRNIKQLRDALNTVVKENSIAPGNADMAFAKSKMALVYDASVVDNFFGLITSTTTYAAPLLTVEEGLPAKLANTRLGFDPFKQTLTYNGILGVPEKAALETAADSLVLADMSVITAQTDLNTFISDFKTALQAIAGDGATDLTSLNEDYPELKTIYDTVAAVPNPAEQTKLLLEGILPELVSRLKNSGLRQTLAALLKAENDTIDTLTGRKEVLASAANNAETVLFDFLQLEEGVSFNGNQTYQFYLDAPATDDYSFYAAAPQNTTVTVKVTGQAIINNAVIGASGEVKNTTPVSLQTGILHLCELTIANLPAGGQLHLSWRTKGMAKNTIPASAIYRKERTDAALSSFLRLQKAVSLQRLLKLTARELSHLAADNSETSNILNNLDTNGTIIAAQLQAQWTKLKHLVFLALVKKENEPEENTWVQILENPSVKTPQNLFLLEGINLWQETDVTQVLAHFGYNRSDLSKLSVLKKIMRAMQLILGTNYTAATVLPWITANPNYALVSSIKQTIKDNSTEAAYMETMPTVSDPLRNKLRDALVAYILNYKKPSPEIITPDKLYEYFLIDVQMMACMKTSRIRQALSTVQLFIQRCLMNLEPDVAPASIRAQQWVWMKRYRVWEANRKVFLYPENWLEPELRDNKSSFFKELEGELLAGEITDETAELAFLNYLKKLDDVARLEMVGMYLEENEQGNQDDDILHVFGRTNGNTRQYYYRRYEYGYWTPWEKISLNIEGDYIFPVVWKKRLFLFWLNHWEKGGTPDTGAVSDSTTAGSLTVGTAKKPPLRTVNITMSWGEYYKGKWTSPKSSDINEPIVLENLNYFNPVNIRLYARKEKPQNKSERLIFALWYGHTGYNAGFTITYTSKNAPPIIVSGADTTLLDDVGYFNTDLYSSSYPNLYRNASANLVVNSRELKLNVKQPANAATSFVTEPLITKKPFMFSGFRLLPLRHKAEKQFEGPFAYADERSTFFVQPDEEVIIPLNRYDGYYYVDAYKPIRKFEEIPKLIEESIPGWPPYENLIPGTDKIFENPWQFTEGNILQNVNINKMMPADAIFTFGDVKFGSAGQVPKEQIQQFKL